MSGAAFDPGFGVRWDLDAMAFRYATGTFGPGMEIRRLDDIRQTLLDSTATGPERVYAIAMDMGQEEDRGLLLSENLLFGACIYASGRIGREPVRSQGHIHAVSASCSSSTPELYEIWQGEAIIVMQPGADEQTPLAYAVRCGVGDKVIVPPGWAHYTLNADPEHEMVFGAWCVRDYGFDYADVRRMRGLAYYPLLNQDGGVGFVRNPAYHSTPLVEKAPGDLARFRIPFGQPMYPLLRAPDKPLDFVARPALHPDLWVDFVP